MARMQNGVGVRVNKKGERWLGPGPAPRGKYKAHACRRERKNRAGLVCASGGGSTPAVAKANALNALKSKWPRLTGRKWGRARTRSFDGMTRKDYVETAKILSRASPACRSQLVDDFARMFAADNPNFNASRFKAAIR